MPSSNHGSLPSPASVGRVYHAKIIEGVHCCSLLERVAFFWVFEGSGNHLRQEQLGKIATPHLAVGQNEYPKWLALVNGTTTTCGPLDPIWSRSRIVSCYAQERKPCSECPKVATGRYLICPMIFCFFFHKGSLFHKLQFAGLFSMETIATLECQKGKMEDTLWKRGATSISNAKSKSSRGRPKPRFQLRIPAPWQSPGCPHS